MTEICLKRVIEFLLNRSEFGSTARHGMANFDIRVRDYRAQSSEESPPSPEAEVASKASVDITENN